MAVTAAYEQTALSVSTTELSLINGTSTLTANTTAGVYQLFIDGVANMAKGDEFLVRITEKVRSGGTARIVFQTKISDAQAEAFVAPPLMLLNGWHMTLTRTAGSDRAFDTSIRRAS